MLEKLNNTTNRLKSSLNGFYKANKNDVYQWSKKQKKTLLIDID